MVDIAFLLLIFYMVSTVFSQPQAMEIDLPKKEAGVVEVLADNVLTLWVDKDDALFWAIGKADGRNLPELIQSDQASMDSISTSFDSESILSLLREKNRMNEKLNTRVLIHPEARFSAMVEILDDISLTERVWNLELARLLGKELDELTKEDGRFSYRYALGEWEDRYDRMLTRARNKSL
jgi:biopolymer transport protein ExbD